jgi:hypothetical protein
MFLPHETAMTTTTATRVMKARRESICPLCRGVIHVGQLIAKCGFWAHATCQINHHHQEEDQ